LFSLIFNEAPNASGRKQRDRRIIFVNPPSSPMVPAFALALVASIVWNKTRQRLPNRLVSCMSHHELGLGDANHGRASLCLVDPIFSS
jgi:hypothetical protein